MAISDTFGTLPVLLQTVSGVVNMPVTPVSIGVSNHYQTIGKAWQKKQSEKRQYVNRVLSQRYMFESIQDAFEFKNFFTARQGSYDRFFVPTWLNSYQSSSTQASTTSLNVIIGNRDSFISSNNIQYKNILVLEDNLGSSRQYSRITACTAATGTVGNDVLTLNAAVSVKRDSIITPVLFCRFAVDEMTIEAVKGGMFSIETSFVEVQGGQ